MGKHNNGYHHHIHRRRHHHSARALWPDTTMAHAFLISLTRWALTHHDDFDAKVVLPIGVVSAEELINVLRALERSRQQNYASSTHQKEDTEL